MVCVMWEWMSVNERVKRECVMVSNKIKLFVIVHTIFLDYTDPFKKDSVLSLLNNCIILYRFYNSM